jgi:hypothetical protein
MKESFLENKKFLSKIGTHLLASLGNKGKNRNSLACLRNAGSHSGVSYCRFLVQIWQNFNFCTDWHAFGTASVFGFRFTPGVEPLD